MQKFTRVLMICGAGLGAYFAPLGGGGAAGAGLGFGAAHAQTQPPAQGQITVTGTGVVQAVPDLATVVLGVTNQAQTAAAALDANNAAMGAVMERLSLAGIAPRDLQTSNLQLNPNWLQTDTMQTPQISGYTASNMLTVHVRDLAVLGSVLDAAVQDGANTLQGVSFGQADAKPAEEAARTAAVLDARARASAMLGAAGAGLGRILAITESSFYAQPMPLLRMASQDSGVSVAAGELGITAQVTMVFEIVQD